jgi:hypothetical protein
MTYLPYDQAITAINAGRIRNGISTHREMIRCLALPDCHQDAMRVGRDPNRREFVLRITAPWKLAKAFSVRQ